MRSNHHPLLLLLTLLLFGCSSKSGTADPELPAERMYQESLETVNLAVMTTFTELGLDVDSFDVSTGIFRTKVSDFSTRRSLNDYMYCGEGALGAYTQVPGFRAQHVIDVRLRETDGQTGLLVRVTFTGRTNGNRVGCRSSGELEHELIEAFETAIASARG